MTDTTQTSGDTGNGGTAATGAAPAVDTGTTTQQSQQTQPWYSGFDQDTVGWMENRGLTKLDEKGALENTIKGFRNAEKYVGVPHEKLLRIPDWDKSDQVELDQFFSKLGRPASPKEYNLPVPEGAPSEFADWAAGIFHEAGLNDRQGLKIAAKWNEYVSAMTQKEAESYQNAIAQQDKELKAEWGVAYEKEVTAAKKAAQGLGLKGEQIDALEKTLGFAGLMRMMANIGKKIGEDSFISSGSGNGNFGAMTPASARARITQLQGDKEWAAKYLSGNVQAQSEMESLMKMAYPSQA